MSESENQGAPGGPGTKAIFVVDELHLKAGCLDSFLVALEERYRPGAEARGQHLVQTLVTPPTTTEGIAQSVLLLWRLEGIAGFWQVRSQNATPEVAAWWADCDEFIESRTRRYAAAPEALPSFDALGRVNEARRELQAALASRRPFKARGEAEQLLQTLK